MYEVSPEYFEAMGIPLLSGRTFNEGERSAQPTTAIIINQRLAERFWPGQSVLGKRIIIGTGNDDPSLEVIGVVGNTHHHELDGEAPLQFYLPYEQSHWMVLTYVVRSTAAAATLFPAMRKLVQKADPKLPPIEPEWVQARVAEATGERRVTMYLLGAFALLALVLAMVGLYGLISYGAAQRTHELAIRVALGADAREVIALVMRRGAILTAYGLALGLMLALAAGRVLSSLLYGVSPSEPWIYGAIGLVLGSIAMVASYLPGRRATRVSPLFALRGE
jgi:putative ABC transport system permease protein